ncbi:MAG: hypothetical protein K5657_00275 [Desulfovibrio sp.]|nr:hypothetical protein [Desulfovibrio sp.]
MTSLTRNIVRLFSALCIAIALLVLGQIDSLAMQCTEALFPGAGVWVLLSLLGLEACAGYWLYRALFGRPSKLMLRLDATEEERAAFARELEKRLAANRHIQKAGISPDQPDFLVKAMDHLDGLAEAEIRSNGKKVFLGTALAQNGRLDALIVFFSLCRMVWRISSLYNQKPTADEIWSVCSTVSQSTFVAFSIDALDIPQTITETMNELVPSVAPAMAASSVPLVGSAVHVFTHSLIEGAANCLLAVRAGVITRRAYRFAIEGGEDGLRRSCARETASIMIDLSQETVGSVATALRKELQEISLDNGKKLVAQAGKLTRSIGSGALQAVNGVAKVSEKTFDFAKDSAKTALTTVKEGAELTASGVVRASGKTLECAVSGARSAFTTVKNGAESGASDIAKASKEGLSHAVEGAEKAFSTVKEGAQQAVSLAKRTQEQLSVMGEEAGKAVGRVKDKAEEALMRGREQAKERVRHVSEGLESVKSKTSTFVQDKREKIGGLFTSAKKGLTGLFGAKTNSAEEDSVEEKVACETRPPVKEDGAEKGQQPGGPL